MIGSQGAAGAEESGLVFFFVCQEAGTSGFGSVYPHWFRGDVISCKFELIIEIHAVITNFCWETEGITSDIHLNEV